MIESDRDTRIRLNVFEFLKEQKHVWGGDLPWSVLSNGFEFEGERVPLVGPQGIFKPKILTGRIPLSITTTPIRPGRARRYDDKPGPDGLIVYKYRDTGPDHHENVRLRLAMREQVPLVYFEGIASGWYSAQFPAYIVADNRELMEFRVAVDEQVTVGTRSGEVSDRVVEARRAYATQISRRRIHQDRFRHNVLAAYRGSCAICSLKQRPLLEAAHIIPDRDLRGVPEVSNGLSLCRLHHAAYDSHIVGIRPDLVVEVRSDIRKQKDGPMLIHGLQGCHGESLMVIPRNEASRPRADFLDERYQLFRKAI